MAALRCMFCWPTKVFFRSIRSIRFAVGNSILGGHPGPARCRESKPRRARLGTACRSVSAWRSVSACKTRQPRDRRSRRRRDRRRIGMGSRNVRGQASAVEPDRGDRLQQGPVCRVDARNPGSGTACRQVAGVQFRNRRSRWARCRRHCATCSGAFRSRQDRPTAVICHTAKGKGMDLQKTMPTGTTSRRSIRSWSPNSMGRWNRACVRPA